MSDDNRRHSRLQARRNAATFVALMGLLAMAAGLLALAAMVLPQLVQAGVLIVGGFVGFFLFHYFTWGWILSRSAPVVMDTSEPLPEQDDAPGSDVDLARFDLD